MKTEKFSYSGTGQALIQLATSAALTLSEHEQQQVIIECESMEQNLLSGLEAVAELMVNFNDEHAQPLQTINQLGGLIQSICGLLKASNGIAEQIEMNQIRSGK